MATIAEEREQRLEHLAQHWLEHCREVGHTPLTEGGTATFDANWGKTYICCCARQEGSHKACNWSFETERNAIII